MSVARSRSSSLPADSPAESPMEFVGQASPSGVCGLLGVPGLSALDVDDDDGEVVIGIRPKSSPLPRRKSSVTDEDSEPEPPPSGSRRVSFADAKGLSLVQVKEFDTWDVPKLPGCDSSEVDGNDAEEYYLSPLNFSLPLSTEELFVKVREQKFELETIELLPGTTILKGVIRVLNISFTKAVYVRTTLDTWSTHFDLLAEYIPGSSDGLTDCFSFRLTLVPPFGEQGARVDFCLRYETPLGTFWTNNNNQNYVLFCHHRVKERKDKPQMESANKKSCLKTVSQTFPTVENTSAMEASSQENISTDVIKHGEGVDTMKAKQISDDQSGKSEEEQQKLQAENRRNCSRKNRRRAARMARVRDLFAQRNGGTNDTGRDESPPEAKQAAQEETPKEKHPDEQSCPERSSKPEGSQFVSESTETSREPLLDVQHDTSPGHDHVSNSQPEKSESINLADSTASRGGESAPFKPGNTWRSNDEPAPVEHQNIDKSVSKAEGNGQEQGTSERMSNAAAEPADSAVLAADSESLVSQANSFTFTTVMAPLYHQVFGRVGSETHTSDDWGNPARAALNVGDLTQSYPHAAGREISCGVPKDADGDEDKVQGNEITTQESKQECLNEEEMTSDTSQDPVEIAQSEQRCTNSSEVSGGAAVHPHRVLNGDLSNSQIPTGSLHLRGEAQEDAVTHDVRSQTTAGAAQAQLPEQTCTQAEVDEALTQSETEEAISSLEKSFTSLQPAQSESESISDEIDQQSSGSGANDFKCVDDSSKDDDIDRAAAMSTSNGTSEEDPVSEALHDLGPNDVNDLAPKEAANSVCVFTIVEEKAVATPQISPKTQEETNPVEEEDKVTSSSCKDETTGLAEIAMIGEVAESVSQTMISSYHGHSGIPQESDTENASKDDDIIFSEKSQRHDVEAAASEQEGLCVSDTTEVKNWETMVEEEEKNTLTDEDQSEAASLEAEDVEAVEDTGRETVSESRDATEEKKEKTEDVTVGEITAGREKENKAENADILKNKQRIGEEDIGGIAAGKNRKEFEYFQNKTAGEEELAEETEGEKREEQEDAETVEEKHFAEIQGVNIERTNVQEEEETEGEEGMETDVNDAEEAGVELEVEENTEEPQHKEETLVDETRESEIADAESESMTIEDRGNEAWCSEERSDITQNKAEDGLSALMNNVPDETASDEENPGGGQNTHTPSEIHLCREEIFRSDENVTRRPPIAARDGNEHAADEATGEPESEQTDDDSASAESDSDDEVELYMHCLRAVHTGAQVSKDRSKDAGFNVGKRPSVSRGKLLSTPMPSISESLDEEQQPPQDVQEGFDTTDFQPAAAAPESSGEESVSRNVSWWREAFSCSSISKTLLYATMFVLFVVVAYHYDFLACFGLYLISVVWLYYQDERQPVKNNNRIG